jgi:hypothetical protein
MILYYSAWNAKRFGRTMEFSNVAPRNALLPSPIFENAERLKNGKMRRYRRCAPS